MELLGVCGQPTLPYCITWMFLLERWFKLNFDGSVQGLSVAVGFVTRNNIDILIGGGCILLDLGLVSET